MPFYSPLRYPGGKGRLGSWMADLLRVNKISGGWYAEPYAGGAGVALHLLLEGYVRKVYINDLDPVVYAFWHSVLNESDRLLDKLYKTPVDMHQRDIQVNILKDHKHHTLLDIGFAVLFVNRTSRSGILGGGVIGGKAQQGKWKIDARFNKSSIAKRIQVISRYSSKIFLSNLDAINFLDVLPTEGPSSGLIYLDPPYFNKGGDLYKNSYISNDHRLLSEKIKRLSNEWVVTYDDTPEIESLYEWAQGGKFEIYYTANDRSRRKAKELIYFGGLNTIIEPYLKR